MSDRTKANTIFRKKAPVASQARGARSGKWTKTTIKFPRSLHTELRVASILSGREMSDMVAKAVQAYLKTLRKKWSK